MGLVKSSNAHDGTSVNPGSELGQRVLAVESKINHLGQRNRSKLFALLHDSDVVACSIKDLCPADITVGHSSDLTDGGPIHHRARRMSPRHNELVRK